MFGTWERMAMDWQSEHGPFRDMRRGNSADDQTGAWFPECLPVGFPNLPAQAKAASVSSARSRAAAWRFRISHLSPHTFRPRIRGSGGETRRAA